MTVRLTGDGQPCEWCDSCTLCIPAKREDNVNHPEHYNKGDIECIDAIEAAVEDFASYCQGNALKYLYRHAYKGNPVEDLEKAIWYIERLKKTYAADQPLEKHTEETFGKPLPWWVENPETD